ncbi:Carboxyvinyl-carboxyphosphonate phosphorylmutase [Achlya hypogyna]|uniref:Carboxyvinyl-carboxyphosphonate phosphorylmutase n=1 Tax=Achlya hypogyna TaxID=1202772 RepID=A0A1V9YZP1_ACHHY|nr:Carboxyvinyl-carboxyphosphonate phosphorylmutase [Achlya hypogyna]
MSRAGEATAALDAIAQAIDVLKRHAYEDMQLQQLSSIEVAVAGFRASLGAPESPRPTSYKRKRRSPEDCCSMSLERQAEFAEAARVQRSLHPQLPYTLFLSTFDVPRADPWPAHLQGKSLRVCDFRQVYRYNKLDPAIVAAMDAISFVWDLSEYQWESKLAALETYHRLHGHVAVPTGFVVPIDDPAWHPDHHGLRLGKLVVAMRNRAEKLTPMKRQQLQRLGFVWTVQASISWHDKTEALGIFRHLHGHVNVPQKFEVPAKDASWPRRLWHMKLGVVVSTLRTRRLKLPSAHVAELDAMGFVWTVHKKQTKAALV